MIAVYPVFMRASKCHERGTQKKQSKPHFIMPSSVVGELRLAVATPGVEFIAQITTKTAGVENSVSQVSGAHLLAHQITASKFDG